jgi:biotin operon repressor
LSRAARLLTLMEALRRRRRPVAGATLADELGVSLRTLYRDIAALQAQGADIAGEAGLGYVLKPGFTLPPLMLSIEEVEALTLGALWVGERADSELARAAEGALAKLAAVMPPDRAELVAAPSSLVGPGRLRAHGDEHLKPIRATIRRAQAGARLCRRGRRANPARRLADGDLLFRGGADPRRLMRDPRGVSPFPRRSRRGGRGEARALPPPAPGAAGRMEDGRNRAPAAARLTMIASAYWRRPTMHPICRFPDEKGPPPALPVSCGPGSRCLSPPPSPVPPSPLRRPRARPMAASSISGSTMA